MERIGLGKYINIVRKDRGLTSDRLSELCNINATYLRQIESGVKIPSLPVFIDICNALKISPDYLLQDDLEENEVTKIKELEAEQNQRENKTKIETMIEEKREKERAPNKKQKESER